MKNIILLLLIVPFSLVAQDVDMDRMNRDLKVAENGLRTLIQGDNSSRDWTSGQNNFFSFNSRSIEGQYIKDYGVIFTAELCEPCYTRKSKNKDKGDPEALAIHLEEAAKTFLADYGSIIGQLKGSQKIMIRFTDEGHSNIFPRALQVVNENGQNTTTWVTGNTQHDVTELAYFGNDKHQGDSQEITVEAVVADLQANMSGNLSRDALLNKIKTEVKTISFKADPQLETFTAMLHRLYQKDLSSTFFMSSEPSYSKISGVGVMIKARVYSSNVHDNKRYTIPTIGKADVSLEERNAIVQEMLPEFEKVFKENIVSYARTIRSLAKGQSIMFEVRLTECKGCEDFPKYINFSISQETLDQFNKGKLSFEQAANKISVERRSS